MNEKTMIHLIQKHNTSAFEKFIDKYSYYVGTIIFGIIGSSMTKEDIEEVALDVFLEIWKNPHKLCEGKLKPFLASVSRNLSYNKLREAEINSPLEDGFNCICELSENEIERIEKSELLSKALNVLSENEREIILQFYYYDKPSAEIADNLSISVTNVTSILSRARKKLKKYLKSQNIKI